MSNGLSRAVRRKRQKDERIDVMYRNKESLYNHLHKAEDELRDSLEHLYTGMWFSAAAIAMHRCGLSQRTIKRVFKATDDLYGQIVRNELTPEQLKAICEEETGIGVSFHVDRNYAEIQLFEDGTSGRQNLFLDNITNVKHYVVND